MARNFIVVNAMLELGPKAREYREVNSVGGLQGVSYIRHLTTI